LATVYGIVRQNRGFISVDSTPFLGTTFTIYLPRYDGPGEEARTEGPRDVAPRGHETILLVEDELAILNLTKRMLEHHGYTVLAAGSPGEAIRLSEEHRDEIDLLMTDVIMPEMNGRALASSLLSANPLVKRLFMSGYTADVIARNGVLEQGVHFIQKPFSTSDVARKVRDALDAPD
jgi:two-component system cell cycle sensor histidine kinase/response regulator CckA